jgi:pimeloyl-ACP methyl ester carboxylesterase
LSLKTSRLAQRLLDLIDALRQRHAGGPQLPGGMVAQELVARKPERVNRLHSVAPRRQFAQRSDRTRAS